ncbi:putative sensor histidine kinase TcrY [Mycobacterium simulans]|uniref:sensor histidine kinase n=1 Tax=Mycobacterium simulans TaxID=627089 RepID=UPI00174899F6|nr:ATP-binding protein [Mycobacterium simulans]SON61883.1 putative sensor histidine kinase TcrY [Mycobacterium simulans]
MMRRWPIRIRLTAAFTAVMALVLLAVANATIAHTRQSLDNSITESLTAQLVALGPLAATATPLLAGGDPDTGQQVIATDGQVLASTPTLAGQAALSPTELDTTRGRQLVVDHPRMANLQGPVRIAAASVPGGRVVVVAQSLADRDAAVADLRTELTVGTPIVLLAAAVGAYLLAAAALSPVERMRARAATISATDTEARLPVGPARDEIDRLGTTFNQLLDRLRAALQRERQFVTDAGHELRTPLSLLTTELELALRRPRTNRELIAALRSALDETTRLSRLARDLLTVADASGPAQPPTIEVKRHLDATADRYRPTLGDQLIIDCPSPVHVRAAPDDLDRIIANLIENAARHGTPPITIRAQPADPDIVEMRVHDRGPGFDPVFLPRAFERFTRADTARTAGGTGLGLAIVDTLTRRNHGTATIRNHPGGGAEVTIRLPAAPAPAATPA